MIIAKRGMTMRFILRRGAPCVVAIMAAFGASVARSDEQAAPAVRTAEEFRNLYLPRLEALEQEHAAFEAVAERERKAASWPKPRYQRITVYAHAAKQSYQVVKSELEAPAGAAAAPFGLPQPGFRQVASTFPKGQFHLRAESNRDDYQIVGVGERHRGVIGAHIDDSKSIFLCAWHAHGLSMRELLERPNFRIRSIASDAKTGHVNVTFEDKGPNPSWRELQVEFAPELAWRIRASKAIHAIPENDPSYSDYERMEVDDNCVYEPRGGTFVPSEITTRWTRYPKDSARPALVTDESRTRIVRFEHKEISEAQFLPSAFGIPDSVLVEDAGGAVRNPLATYWIISIVVLAAIVLAYVWVRRRRDMT